MNPRLYIGNLSSEVTEHELRLLFSRAGTVDQVELMLDAATQQSRGFAFVTMATPESAASALRDFHCYNLGGRYITVTEARPPEAPKGLMSEGFGVSESSPFRSDTQRRRHRPRAPKRRGGKR